MTDPMLDAPRTVLTPHMASQTSETLRRAATMSVENILNYFRGAPSHVANPEALKVFAPKIAAESLTAPCAAVILLSTQQMQGYKSQKGVAVRRTYREIMGTFK